LILGAKGVTTMYHITLSAVPRSMTLRPTMKATIEELPQISAEGESLAEALRNLADAVEGSQSVEHTASILFPLTVRTDPTATALQGAYGYGDPDWLQTPFSVNAQYQQDSD